MTAGHLTIRVGDQAYGLRTSSAEAMAYFRRAYTACLGHPAEETGRFSLQRRAGSWRLRGDGAEVAIGSLGQLMWRLDWELAHRAVKQDSACAAFHAAWVARGRRAAMLAGEGSSGKSHVCLQLLEGGWRCGAEDVTFLSGDRLEPFPRAIQLRSDDPALRHVAPSRVFAGCDGRICIEVQENEAARNTPAASLLVVFLDPAASRRPPRPLAPLLALQRLFGLCHRLNRVTQPSFATLANLATAGRMFVLPPQDAAGFIQDIAEV